MSPDLVEFCAVGPSQSACYNALADLLEAKYPDTMPDAADATYRIRFSGGRGLVTVILPWQIWDQGADPDIDPPTLVHDFGYALHSVMSGTDARSLARDAKSAAVAQGVITPELLSVPQAVQNFYGVTIDAVPGWKHPNQTKFTLERRVAIWPHLFAGVDQMLEAQEP